MSSESRPCMISPTSCSTRCAVTYSSTTDCKVKLPDRCPRSTRLRRCKPSTASNICPANRPGQSLAAQLLERHRLAQRCQPKEQGLLQRGESAPVLVEQVTDAAKDERVLGQEGRDLPPEEIGDGLGHDVQSQGIALVALHQAGLLLWRAEQLMADQQLLAGGRREPERRKERTSVWRPSRARSAAGFSRLVSSRQL